MTAGELSAPVCAVAADILRQRTGLAFDGTRRPTLEAGLVTAMKRAGTSDSHAYLARLERDDAVLDDLVAEITIGETYFFRDPQQFAVIRDRILPDILTVRSPAGPVRVWSAGCASGEEAYTLAILAHELGISHVVRIRGTDLSRAALARARQARYTRWSLRGLSVEIVERYFERSGGSGGQFAPRAGIRDAVEFGYLNLAADTYPSLRNGIWGMDLILCRNVLIYLDAETIARVARQLLAALAPDGWLVLGASDPPLADFAPCEVVVTDAGLAYRRGQGHRRDPRPPAAESRRGPAPALTPVAQPTVAAAAVAEPPPREPESATPPDSRLHAEEAFQAYARRDYDRAATLAEQLAAQPGSAADLWVLLVRSAANRGDLEAAGRACMAGLERRPTCAELVYLHGLLLAEGGRLKDAVSAFRRSLYLDRALAVVHLTLGQVLARLGERDGARRSLRNAGRLFSGMLAEEAVPAADGERPGRLAEMSRVHLALLDEPVAP